MTGLELCTKQDGKLIVFKVRHDGFEIEDFLAEKFPDQAKIFDMTPRDFIDSFYNFFFKSGYSSSDIDTCFPKGFEMSVTKAQAKKLKTADDVVELAHGQLDKLEQSGKILTPDGETCDGYMCSYSDYQVLVDWDKKEVTGLDWDDDYDDEEED